MTFLNFANDVYTFRCLWTLGSRKFGEFKIRTLLKSRARRPSVPEVSNAVSHVHRSLNNWVRASELDHLNQTIWAKASEPDAETPANWPPRFSSARPASQDSCGKSRTRCIIKSVAEIHLSKSLYFRHFGRGSKTIRTIPRYSSIFPDIQTNGLSVMFDWKAIAKLGNSAASWLPLKIVKEPLESNEFRWVTNDLQRVW